MLPYVYILISNDAESVVKTMKMFRIVNILISVAVIKTYGTISVLKFVLKSQRSLATSDILMDDVACIAQLGVDRVVALDINQRIVGRKAEITTEFVSYLCIKVYLFKVEIFYHSISTVVAHRNER